MWSAEVAETSWRDGRSNTFCQTFLAFVFGQFPDPDTSWWFYTQTAAELQTQRSLFAFAAEMEASGGGKKAAWGLSLHDLAEVTASDDFRSPEIFTW